MMKGEKDGGKAAVESESESGELKQCKYKSTPKNLSVKKPLEFKTSKKNVSLPAAIYRGRYHPTTDETRAAYDEIFNIIKNQELFACYDYFFTVRFYVDRILGILKDDAIDNDFKKREVNLILNSIPDDLFDRLVSIADLLTDFHDPVDPSAYPDILFDPSVRILKSN